MASIAFVILIMLSGLFVQAETVVRGGNGTDNAIQAQKISPEQLFTEQLCKQFSSDIKKFGDCVEWEKNLSMAHRMWAEGQCGGNKAYEKNASDFEKCAEAKQTENRFKRILAAEKCGGFDSYSKASRAFRKCTDAEFKKAQKISPEQLFTEQLCKQFSSDIKKFEDCVEWEKNLSMAHRMWAEGQCGGNKAYENNASDFEKCAEAKQTENRFKRILAVDKCGGFDSYSKASRAFRKCADAEFKKQNTR